MRRAQVVDRRPVIRQEAHAIVDHARRGVHLERGPVRRHEDAQAPAQDRELDVRVVALHGGSAREPVAGSKERLLGAGRAQRIAARGDLDDALVAAPGPTARGRHDQLQLIGRVEERPPADEGDAVAGVDQVRCHPRSIGSGPPATARASALREAPFGT